MPTRIPEGDGMEQNGHYRDGYPRFTLTKAAVLGIDAIAVNDEAKKILEKPGDQLPGKTELHGELGGN